MPHGVMNIGRLSIYGVINTFSTGNLCQLVLNLVNSISLPVGLESAQGMLCSTQSTKRKQWQLNRMPEFDHH